MGTFSYYNLPIAEVNEKGEESRVLYGTLTAISLSVYQHS